MGDGNVSFLRLKNKVYARILTRFPFLGKKFINSYEPWETDEIPWTAVTRPLGDCNVFIVTTAGVHLRIQTPFNMEDPLGDPTFREIPGTCEASDLAITHDYYDHADADKDVNIVFPIERLAEFAREGLIGGVGKVHYGFMGHINGRHIHTLVTETAPEVATKLKAAGADVVLLTPG